MISVTTAGKPVDWPKDSQKYDIYTNEEWMYELLFSSQQQKVKDFGRHCCNVLFPHVQQQLSNKLYPMEIEDVTGVSRPLSLQMKPINRILWGLMKSINRPLKKKMQHLHWSMMIYKLWIWKRSFAGAKRCLSGPATKMSRHHHPS